MTAPDDHRLPREVRPVHYDLSLEPHLVAATFDGRVAIDVDVHMATDVFVCNAAELEVVHAEVRDAGGLHIPAMPALDAERERLALRLDDPVEPGRYLVILEFTGVLNDQLRGFHRSAYIDERGAEKVIATTQFEAADARRAFPCWDEPDFKATFEVTLVVPEGATAVSCSPIVGIEPLEVGRERVRFATTMPLSTYLLAFVVGDLVATEPRDVDGTPLRIVHVPGKEDLTGFALDFGTFALRWFTKYYGIAYPGDKLDLIAIPDFASGAMENLGAITFRESLLLVDPEHATQAELSRVAEVIAHEIAHMWFGNLVTMKWWNGLWLKEAFATFMAMLCVDAFRPEWDGWLAFAAERERAMEIDGLHATRPIEFEVHTPDEADEMFDDITYGKGAAVLRMIEQFVGPETFRGGVAAYLSQHAYGTTDTPDLWAALDEASQHPVEDIMEAWIYTPGHPVVHVEPQAGGYRLHQRRFTFTGTGDGHWRVPMVIGGDDRSEPLVLDDAAVITGDRLPNLHHGGSGVYRVSYADGLWNEVVASAPDLRPAERHRLAGDTWAAVLAGTLSATDYLRLLTGLARESDVRIWDQMLDGLDELDRIVAPARASQLHRFVRDLVRPLVDALGWAPRPGESDLDERCRGTLIRALGVLGRDRKTHDRAMDAFEQALRNDGRLDGEVAAAAVAVAAAHGGDREHSRLAAAYAGARTPQDEARYLAALAAIPDAGCAAATVELVTRGRLRSQHAAGAVARLIGNRKIGGDAWRLVTERWDEIIEAVPRPAQHNLVVFAHLRSEPDLSPDLETWLTDHPLPAAERGTRQQLERLAIRRELRRREAELRVPPVALS